MTARSLAAVVAHVLDIDPAAVGDDAGMNVTENWHSLNQVMVISAIELEFGARVTFREMEEVSTLAGIRALLRRQGIAFGD